MFRARLKTVEKAGAHGALFIFNLFAAKLKYTRACKFLRCRREYTRPLRFSCCFSFLAHGSSEDEDLVKKKSRKMFGLCAAAFRED